MKTLWQVDIAEHGARPCGGIVTDGDTVVAAAPIFQWMVGRSRDEVRRWVASKNGKVTRAFDNVTIEEQR